MNFDNQRCLSGGWGRNKFGKKGEFSKIMKKVELPVVSGDDCQHLLRRIRLGVDFKLNEGFLCAGNYEISNSYIK